MSQCMGRQHSRQDVHLSARKPQQEGNTSGNASKENGEHICTDSHSLVWV